MNAPWIMLMTNISYWHQTYYWCLEFYKGKLIMIIHSLQLANEGIWTRFLQIEIEFCLYYNPCLFYLMLIFTHFSDGMLHAVWVAYMPYYNLKSKGFRIVKHIWSLKGVQVRDCGLRDVEEFVLYNAFMYISPSDCCKRPLKSIGQVWALFYMWGNEDSRKLDGLPLWHTANSWASILFLPCSALLWCGKNN